MNISRSKIVGAVMIAAAIALAWPATSEFLAVDACLDAGGSFDAILGACDLKVSHPYVASLAYVQSPFGSPWFILIGVMLGLVGLVVFVGKGPRS